MENNHKMAISLSNEKIDFPTRSVLKEGSGTVLGRFWEDFEGVLDGL